MIAEKYVGMKVVKNKIFREYEFIKLPITKGEIEELASVLDDPTEAFECYGVSFDYNDDIVDIDIDSFLDQIEDEIGEDPDAVSHICKDLRLKFREVRKKGNKGFHLSPELEIKGKK